MWLHVYLYGRFCVCACAHLLCQCTVVCSLYRTVCPRLDDHRLFVKKIQTDYEQLAAPAARQSVLRVCVSSLSGLCVGTNSGPVMTFVLKQKMRNQDLCCTYEIRLLYIVREDIKRHF